MQKYTRTHSKIKKESCHKCYVLCERDSWILCFHPPLKYKSGGGFCLGFVHTHAHRFLSRFILKQFQMARRDFSIKFKFGDLKWY